MIKVLDKSFAVLEALAETSPKPRRITELAAELGINGATCARILRELVDSGYAIQISRQDGYAAGPRAWSFGQRIHYRPRLVDAARPLVEEISRAHQASVLLAERNGLERYILLHESHCRKYNVEVNRLSYHDLFNSATGLLLAAFAEPEELDSLAKEYHGKFDLFPREQLRPELEKIRREAGCVRRNSSQGIAAFAVFTDGRFTAVLGGSMEREFFTDDFAGALRRGADDLSKRISANPITG